MPGYSTRRDAIRPPSKPGKRQQQPADGCENSDQQQQDHRGCSGTARAAVGAKRKRSEASAPDHKHAQQADKSAPQTTGTTAVVHPSSAARSDQQKAKKSPARLPSKPKSNSRRPKPQSKSVDSEYDSEDEIPLYTLSQKQKPAAPLGGRHSGSKQQAGDLFAKSPHRDAAAAASALAFFGKSKSGQGKPSAVLAANSGLPPFC
ncbi:hypothetical protein ABBQ38_013809 [Trebouxia sp. C0009 RCD-2024]